MEKLFKIVLILFSSFLMLFSVMVWADARALSLVGYASANAKTECPGDPHKDFDDVIGGFGLAEAHAESNSSNPKCYAIAYAAAFPANKVGLNITKWELEIEGETEGGKAGYSTTRKRIGIEPKIFAEGNAEYNELTKELKVTFSGIVPKIPIVVDNGISGKGILIAQVLKTVPGTIDKNILPGNDLLEEGFIEIDQLGIKKNGFFSDTDIGENGNFSKTFIISPVDNPDEIVIHLYHHIESPPLLTKLSNLEITTVNGKDDIFIEWKTDVEIKNAGYHIWRATKKQYGDYKPTLLREFGDSEQVNPKSNEGCSTKIQGQLKADNSSQPPKLISAIGNSTESTCYSFTDTSSSGDGTYYYLLEDINNNGDSTFHCDQIDAVTIGQGPAIDLESAINYCKKVTGSNN